MLRSKFSECVMLLAYKREVLGLILGRRIDYLEILLWLVSVSLEEWRDSISNEAINTLFPIVCNLLFACHLTIQRSTVWRNKTGEPNKPWINHITEVVSSSDFIALDRKVTDE
jgi:hypothetical protein